MPITPEERLKRQELMDSVRAKGAAMRQQVRDNQWREVDEFVPSVGPYEADIVRGVQEYCSQFSSLDWSAKSATAFVQHYAYDTHPGDIEFKAELNSRLRNMIKRRRLNAGEMSCDMGWEDVIHEFLSAVELLPGFRLVDAGEKWGLLRLHYEVDDRSLVVDAERRAVEQSMVTCECCGEPGVHRKGGWWKTTCDKHVNYYAQVSDPYREIKARYSDVYAPDLAPYFRDIECKYGWSLIIREYLDQLRAWKLAGFDVKMRWAKEKFGSLRVFTDLDYRSCTRLERYWVDREATRTRRLSLKVCDMCGQPGRLRWGQRYLATRCAEHAEDMGSMRPEDGIVLDVETHELVNGKAILKPHLIDSYIPDHVLGLDPGQTQDGFKVFCSKYAPMLSADVDLPDDDIKLAQLSKLLWLIDQSIGRHHAVEFKLQSCSDRVSYTVGIDPLYKDEPVSDVEQFQRERIVADIHYIMSHPEC